MLPALFITEKLNYAYFSGHRSCQNPIDKIRSYMFILPKDDAPVLITMPFEVMQVEQTTYIERIKTIGGLTGHPEFIVDTFKSMGLGKARIGAELGREQYLGTNVVALNETHEGPAGGRIRRCGSDHPGRSSHQVPARDRVHAQRVADDRASGV